MAELGATATLVAEVQSAIAAGLADQALDYGAAGMLGTSPQQVTVRFSVDARYAQLTLVAMLAPSPDWFVGVHGLDLLAGGDWVDSLVVPLQVYDAGTDSGATYTSPNANTMPPEPIALVTTASGPFQGASTQVGTFALHRLSITLVYGCGFNPPGSLEVSGSAELGQTLQLSITPPPLQWSAPAVTGVALSSTPDPAVPCGSLLPGFGLVAGAPGEILLGSVDSLAVGPAWTGGTAVVPLPVPNLTSLVGPQFYVQALLADVRVGVTDAVSLRVGS